LKSYITRSYCKSGGYHCSEIVRGQIG